MRRSHFKTSGALALALLTATSGMAPLTAQQAQNSDVTTNNADGSITRRVAMGIGKSFIVDLPRDAAEVFVGNPKVANAVVRSSRKIYVIGTENGQTSVFAMDAQGRRIAQIEISIGRDIGELNAILKAAMPNSNVNSRTVNNTIILTGNVDSAGEAQKAYDIAKGFVPQMGEGGASVEGRVVNSIIVKSRDQVMLKVTAAEVRRDVAKQFGLTSSSMTGKWGSFTQDNPLTLNVTQLSAGGLKLGQTGSPFASTLNAFERYGVTRVLAEPTVTTVSGETAKLTVGGEVPVPSSRTCDAGGCSVGVTFKPYGISLNFTPVVLAEGRILLRFTTEVTELDTQQSLSFNSISIPGFRTNKHETTVELPSGGSIASAGLLTSKTRQAIDGLPGLMNLPILGSLFRSRDYQRQESELLIIVTPYIAKHSNVADLTRPDDGLADASDPQSIFLGRVNRLYSTRSNPQAVQNFKGKVGFIQD